MTINYNDQKNVFLNCTFFKLHLNFSAFTKSLLTKLWSGTADYFCFILKLCQCHTDKRNPKVTQTKLQKSFVQNRLL